MATVTHKCPHCLTDHIGLKIVHPTSLGNQWWIAHLECPKCQMPSAAEMTVGSGRHLDWGTLVQTSADATTQGWEVMRFWPEIPGPEIPENIPPDVARIYLQAERNFPIEGNEEAAGTMYRKALDVALKKIDPSQSGMLGPRIKKLAAAGKLTQDVAVWSDEIRDVGNDAAHEEEPITRDELIALRNFSEMVLRYLFSLPGAVKKRRGEKLDWEDK